MGRRSPELGEKLAARALRGLAAGACPGAGVGRPVRSLRLVPVYLPMGGRVAPDDRQIPPVPLVERLVAVRAAVLGRAADRGADARHVVPRRLRRRLRLQADHPLLHPRRVRGVALPLPRPVWPELSRRCTEHHPEFATSTGAAFGRWSRRAGDLLATTRLGRMPEAGKVTLKAALTDELNAALATPVAQLSCQDESYTHL